MAGARPQEERFGLAVTDCSKIEALNVVIQKNPDHCEIKFKTLTTRNEKLYLKKLLLLSEIEKQSVRSDAYLQGMFKDLIASDYVEDQRDLVRLLPVLLQESPKFRQMFLTLPWPLEQEKDSLSLPMVFARASWEGRYQWTVILSAILIMFFNLQNRRLEDENYGIVGKKMLVSPLNLGVLALTFLINLLSHLFEKPIYRTLFPSTKPSYAFEVLEKLLITTADANLKLETLSSLIQMSVELPEPAELISKLVSPSYIKVSAAALQTRISAMLKQRYDKAEAGSRLKATFATALIEWHLNLSSTPVFTLAELGDYARLLVLHPSFREALLKVQRLEIRLLQQDVAQEKEAAGASSIRLEETTRALAVSSADLATARGDLMATQRALEALRVSTGASVKLLEAENGRLVKQIAGMTKKPAVREEDLKGLRILVEEKHEDLGKALAATARAEALVTVLQEELAAVKGLLAAATASAKERSAELKATVTRVEALRTREHELTGALTARHLECEHLKSELASNQAVLKRVQLELEQRQAELRDARIDTALTHEQMAAMQTQMQRMQFEKNAAMVVSDMEKVIGLPAAQMVVHGSSVSSACMLTSTAPTDVDIECYTPEAEITALSHKLLAAGFHSNGLKVVKGVPLVLFRGELAGRKVDIAICTCPYVGKPAEFARFISERMSSSYFNACTEYVSFKSSAVGEVRPEFHPYTGEHTLHFINPKGERVDIANLNELISPLTSEDLFFCLRKWDLYKGCGYDVSPVEPVLIKAVCLAANLELVREVCARSAAGVYRGRELLTKLLAMGAEQRSDSAAAAGAGTATTPYLLVQRMLAEEAATTVIAAREVEG